jgi:hypothetical protein
MVAWPSGLCAGSLVCRQQGLSSVRRQQPNCKPCTALLSSRIDTCMDLQHAQGACGLAPAPVVELLTTRPFVLCLKGCAHSRTSLVREPFVLICGPKTQLKSAMHVVFLTSGLVSMCQIAVETLLLALHCEPARVSCLNTKHTTREHVNSKPAARHHSMFPACSAHGLLPGAVHRACHQSGDAGAVGR